MSSWCFCFEVAVNITMPCTLPKFGWFHLSLWYYEFFLSPPFHHGCYFEPWFLHLWVTRQLAHSVGGKEKSKWWSVFQRATCEGLFLEARHSRRPKPKHYKFIFFSPPILNSKSAGESPGHHLGKSTRPMLQKPFLHAVSTYVRASDFIMFSLKGKLTQTERRGNSGIVS